MFQRLLVQTLILLSIVKPIPTPTPTPTPTPAQPLATKKVALTFDACMTYGMERKLKDGRAKSYYNKPIIDVLVRQEVPATLFLTGLWAENYPEVTKSLSENSLFEIGNHSYSHPAFTPFCYGLPKIGNRENEFKKSQEILKSITGVYPKLFRFPGGCYSKTDLDLVKKYGLTMVGWDIASGDAFNKNSESIVRRVEQRVKPGAVILLHMNGDINSPVTDKALPEIISYLRAKGYTFVKVSDLLVDK